MSRKAAFGSVTRAAIVVAAVVFAAVVAVRNAGVDAFADRDPAMAQRFWANHPDAAIAVAMQAIGRDAGANRAVGDAAFRQLSQAASNAPLAAEPFTVAAVRYQIAGDETKAEQAFLAARNRDPRAMAPHFFLAQQYLAGGDLRGLDEVAALARLAPEGHRAIAPYLAQFAQQPQARAPMRAMMANDPRIRAAVLSSLASDARNAGLLAALGGYEGGGDRPWLAQMLRSLVEAQDFAGAHDAWTRAAGLPAGTAPLLFDPGFTRPDPLPPFNWELTSSTTGIAERRDGRLHVIYYGEGDGPLARQLLLLPPGNYRLDAPARGDGEANTFLWSARCATAKPEDKLAEADAGRSVLLFAVPAGCPATWLELVGRSDDIGRHSELTVSPVRLARRSAQ